MWNYYEKDNFENSTQYLIPMKQNNSYQIKYIWVIKRNLEGISCGFINRDQLKKAQSENELFFDIFNQKLFGFQGNMYFDLSQNSDNNNISHNDNHIQRVKTKTICRKWYTVETSEYITTHTLCTK